MDRDTVYYSSVEIAFAEGSEYHGDLEGGFVYAFVRARDARDAMPAILEEIAACGLEVVEMEFVAPYEDVPWETEEEQARYDLLARRAQEAEGVVLDDIEAFEGRDD